MRIAVDDVSRRWSVVQGRHECVSCVSTSCRLARDEHVFEVFARSTSGASVYVASNAMFETQPRTFEDLRVEVAPVVHDHHHARTAAERLGRALEHARNALRVLRDRALRGAPPK